MKACPSWFSPGRFALGLALLILAAFPQVILGLETFGARDFGFFVYPLAHFQRDCFWHGELPFWDPYNNCGVPFLAQWNTMPLYPPALLYLTLPLAWSLGVFSLLHLWWAGLGMYCLARRWTGNAFAGAFAGTVFAFNGLTLNLLMWPSHIATFAWMPWVVLAVAGAWREGGKWIPLAALVGAMQMLAGGPETILLTWLIVAGLGLQAFIQGASPRRAMLWRLPVVVALVVGLSAAQLLPFLDLVAHAQRATGYTDLRWSLPGFGLANFLVPMAFGSTVTEGIFFQHGQYWTSSYYLGLGTVWLALAAVLGIRERRVCLLTAFTVVALLCALGEHTFFYPLVRKLIPQLSFITYPVKFVMVVIFAVPLLAAFALAGAPCSDLTQSGNAQPSESAPGALGKRLWPLGLMLLALIGVIMAVTQLWPLPGDDSRAALGNGFSRAWFLVVTGAVLFVLTRATRLNSAAQVNPACATQLSIPARLAPLALILVVWLDVWTHEPRQNPTVPPSVYELNLARAKLAMNPQPELGGSRAMLAPAAALELTRAAVSDPRNNLLAKRLGYCADVNLLDGVPKVDGFFSLTPREFDGLLSLIYSAANGRWSGLEQFMGVSQYTATNNTLAWQPRAGLLPLITAGQKPVFLDDTTTAWTFGRNEFDPRATVFLPPEEKTRVTVSNSAAATILEARFTDRTVDFEAEAGAPAIAVVAQTYYHNWRAEMDGQPTLLLRANVAFQAVQIPAGRHRIHLFYADRAFAIGAAISLGLWVGCVVAWLGLCRGWNLTKHG